jgi:hypothetical protein
MLPGKRILENLLQIRTTALIFHKQCLESPIACPLIQPQAAMAGRR